MIDPIYDRDGITIYHADCLDVLPQINQVDHVITDPPYSDETHSKTWRSKVMAEAGYQRVSAAHDGLGFDALTDAQRDNVLRWASKSCSRWFIAFSDIEGVALWMRSLRAAQMEYVRTCIWDKVDGTPQLTGDRPAVGAEAIVVGHPLGRKRWNGGGRRGVFRHPTNGRTRGAKPHPSTKPVELMRELIELFTDPGDLILDPFMGSGTTLRAAKDLGRRAIGIEMSNEIGADGVDRRYCDIAIQRMAQEVMAL